MVRPNALFLLPFCYEITSLFNLGQSTMQEQTAMTTWMYLENILWIYFTMLTITQTTLCWQKGQWWLLGGMKLDGSAFKATGHKSIKHNHIYFYLSKTTCFCLHRPSSRHYYKTVNIWDPTVWIINALYFN